MSDITTYPIDITSYADGVTIGGTQTSYTWDKLPGSSQTIEIVGDLTNVTVMDNGTDITSSLVSYSWGAVLELTDIQEGHRIIIFIPDVYIKVNGSWTAALQMYVKVNGAWQAVGDVYKKTNGVWLRDDRSAMFDPGALYLKG